MSTYEVKGYGVPLLMTAMAANAGPSTKTVSIVSDASCDGLTLTNLSTGEVVSGATAAMRQLARMTPESTLLGGASAVTSSQMDGWVDMAMNELPPPAVADIIAEKGGVVRTLVNMGVQSSPVLTEARAAVSTHRHVVRALTALQAGLVDRTFLVGDRVSVADMTVFARLSAFYVAFIPAEDREGRYGAVTRWFSTMLHQPFVQAAMAASHVAVGGVRRIGNQIDAKPIPDHVSAQADASIARNVGVKKVESQRQKEKAAKAKAKAKSSGPSAGAGAGAGAGDAGAAPTVPAAATQPESNKTLPSRSANERVSIVEDLLKSKGVKFTTVRHPPAMTVKELLESTGDMAGGKCKNLFLKAKKKKDAADTGLWLVVALHDTATDMKVLATALGYGKIVLRLGKEELLVENLGVAQGNVTPFAVINDKAQKVNLVIDSRMLEEKEVVVHPLTNEASTAIAPADLVSLVTAAGHKPTIVDFAAGAIVQ